MRSSPCASTTCARIGRRGSCAHGGIDIEERASRWRDNGWTGWDGSARSYSVEEAENERRLYGMHADPLSGLPLTLDPEGDNRRSSTIRR